MILIANGFGRCSRSVSWPFPQIEHYPVNTKPASS